MDINCILASVIGSSTLLFTTVHLKALLDVLLQGEL